MALPSWLRQLGMVMGEKRKLDDAETKLNIDKEQAAAQKANWEADAADRKAKRDAELEANSPVAWEGSPVVQPPAITGISGTSTPDLPKPFTPAQSALTNKLVKTDGAASNGLIDMLVPFAKGQYAATVGTMDKALDASDPTKNLPDNAQTQMLRDRWNKNIRTTPPEMDGSENAGKIYPNKRALEKAKSDYEKVKESRLKAFNDDKTKERDRILAGSLAHGGTIFGQDFAMKKQEDSQTFQREQADRNHAAARSNIGLSDSLSRGRISINQANHEKNVAAAEVLYNKHRQEGWSHDQAQKDADRQIARTEGTVKDMKEQIKGTLDKVANTEKEVKAMEEKSATRAYESQEKASGKKATADEKEATDFATNKATGVIAQLKDDEEPGSSAIADAITRTPGAAEKIGLAIHNISVSSTPEMAENFAGEAALGLGLDPDKTAKLVDMMLKNAREFKAPPDAGSGMFPQMWPSFMRSK